MSLADFMKQLQDQDASGIVYSEVPEQPVRVIPPEQTSIKIIAPISQSVPKTPTKIKLKLERPQPAQEQSITYKPIEKPKVIEHTIQPTLNQTTKQQTNTIQQGEFDEAQEEALGALQRQYEQKALAEEQRVGTDQQDDEDDDETKTHGDLPRNPAPGRATREMYM